MLKYIFVLNTTFKEFSPKDVIPFYIVFLDFLVTSNNNKNDS